MENQVVGVIGLGYVGIDTAAYFAKKYKVIGYDVDEHRIELYKQGIDITNEIGPTVNQLGIEFTTDPSQIAHMDFIIVCVQTPGDKNGISTKYLETASSSIEQYIKKGVVVVYSSTVYPGFTEEIIIPILEKNGKKLNEDFIIGYAPERVSPGDPIELTEVTKIISATSKEGLDTLDKMYSSVYNSTFRVSMIKVAEATKVLENTMRDVNIGVLNEFRQVFPDIPFSEVQKAMDTKWNALHFKSGLVGGHCIAVNPYYINYAAMKRGKHLTIIEQARRINEDFYLYFINKIESLNLPNKTVLIKGITYKPNVPDVRTSQVLLIATELRKRGYTVHLEDIVIEHEPQKEGFILVDEDTTKDLQFDCVLYGVIHNEYKNDDLKSHYYSKGIYVVDINGYFLDQRDSKFYIL